MRVSKKYVFIIAQNRFVNYFFRISLKLISLSAKGKDDLVNYFFQLVYLSLLYYLKLLTNIWLVRYNHIIEKQKRVKLMKQVNKIQILQGMNALNKLNDDESDETDIRAVSFYLTGGIVGKYELSLLRNIIDNLLFNYSIFEVADQILEEVNDFLNGYLDNPSHCFSLVFSRLKRLEGKVA